MELLKEQLLAQKDVLSAVRDQLKTEFIGIDSIIDEIMDTISAWYLLPDMQTRPLVVNLWGLTGVGKTSLVRRLVDLLKFNDRFYRLDMGDREQFWKVRYQLEEIHDYSNGDPVIVAMDEFQHLRTIDDEGKEIRGSRGRFIWQLLDDGTVQLSDLSNKLSDISWMLAKAKWLLSKGVVVDKGMVVGNREFFLDHSNRRIFEDWEDPKKVRSADIPFIHTKNYEMIYEQDRIQFQSSYEVEQQLLELDGPGTIDFLRALYEQLMVPKILDCSKALIFVIGNLDEAYRVGGSMDPDINADEFHEYCQKITVPVIKQALQKRFRNEEIARLGNNHMIYPAFDSATYRALIRQTLDRWKSEVFQKANVTIEVDATVEDLIYNEGVYPTQGTRPVYTTAEQLLKSKTGAILVHLWSSATEAKCIHLSVSGRALQAQYLDADVLLDTISFELPIKLETLRDCQQDDHQAVTAVHESGHAICSVMLRGLVPETVLSSTASADSEGYTFTRSKWKYVARKEIVSRVAVLLAGFAAEEIVFGAENVTTGAESDIEKATEFVARMLKHSGMGKVPARYSVKSIESNFRLHDVEDVVNKEIERYLLNGLELARNTLVREEQLLYQMADHLSDHRILEKEAITDLCETYGVAFQRESLVEDETRQFYRSFLKDKVKGVGHSDSTESIGGVQVTLNKNS